MNSITRALIERELADIQECHARAVDQVEHFRERLRKAEEARDEYVEQIGALKEDLARGERADASQRRFNDLIRSFAAVP